MQRYQCSVHSTHNRCWRHDMTLAVVGNCRCGTSYQCSSRKLSRMYESRSICRKQPALAVVWGHLLSCAEGLQTGDFRLASRTAGRDTSLFAGPRRFCLCPASLSLLVCDMHRCTKEAYCCIVLSQKRIRGEAPQGIVFFRRVCESRELLFMRDEEFISSSISKQNNAVLLFTWVKLETNFTFVTSFWSKPFCFFLFFFCFWYCCRVGVRSNQVTSIFGPVISNFTSFHLGAHCDDNCTFTDSISIDRERLRKKNADSPKWVPDVICDNKIDNAKLKHVLVAECLKTRFYVPEIGLCQVSCKLTLQSYFSGPHTLRTRVGVKA